MTTFHIITIFPEIFVSYFDESILRRAQKEGKVKMEVYNLRDFATDKHKTVDDTPYGGGPGMVLKIGPIYRCLEHIKGEIKRKNGDGEKPEISNSPNSTKKIPNSKFQIPNSHIILTSAKGKEYTQADAEKLKELSDVVIICGRYEGVDERVAKNLVDEEISIGKYVLTGGEIPAMVVVDSVTRLLEGVLGNEQSLACETHNGEGKIDYPVYTKPENFQGLEVPKVLLSGNHGEIEKWRHERN